MTRLPLALAAQLINLTSDVPDEEYPSREEIMEGVGDMALAKLEGEVASGKATVVVHNVHMEDFSNYEVKTATHDGAIIESKSASTGKFRGAFHDGNDLMTAEFLPEFRHARNRHERRAAASQSRKR